MYPVKASELGGGVSVVRKNSEKYKMNQQCPSFTNVATVKAWRRLRRSATRRPSKFYFNWIVSTQYEDVSHAAAVVDEDEFKVAANIQWFQFVRSWISKPRID